MVGIPLPGLPRPGEPLTQEIVRRIFHYDPESGALTRTITYGRLVGKRADAKLRQRRRIRIAQRNYLVTRIIWLYVYGHFPECDIDHADRDPLNDRLANLRLATRAQNSANKAKFRSNTTGFKGVARHSRTRWTATIVVLGRRIHLGSFRSADAAGEAYRRAATLHHGKFACAA